MSETLNFGPQWLRALSSGGTTTSVTSPPPSPGITQFKLAEFRYGREEMLALFKKSSQPPSGMEEFLSICRKDSALPMALTPLSEEEQHALSQCVNSTLVLRLTGRGTGGTGVRGRGGPTRGRGRGRGEFIRGGYDEEGGGGGGGFSRNFTRTQSWDESRDSRFRSFEESGPPSPRKHFDRSISENWRSRSERGSTRENGEEDGGWRQAPSRTSRTTRDDDNWRTGGGGPRTSWRQPRERNASFNEYDEDQDRDRERDRGDRPDRRYSARNRQDSYEDAGEDLPEWAMDDAFEADVISSFDSSGAFFSMKKEEKDVNKKEDKIEEEPKADIKTIDSNKEQNALKAKHKKDKELQDNSNSAKIDSTKTSISNYDSTKDSKQEITGEEESSRTPGELLLAEITSKQLMSRAIEEEEQHQTLESVEKSLLAITDNEPTAETKAKTEEKVEEKAKKEVVVEEEEEDPLARIEKEAAEDIVKMTEDDDDEKLLRSITGKLKWQQQQQQQAASKVAAASTDIPRMWFYKDPQGAVQGPFSAGEMADWFGAGYFTMTLLVKRSFDDVFLPLGELIKQWGRVPFMHGLEPPPNKAPAAPQVKVPGPSRKELTPEQQLVLQQQLLQQQMMQLMAHQQQQILMRSYQIQQQFAQKGQILTPQQQQFLLQQLLSKMRQHQYVLQKQQQAQHPGQQPPPQLQRQLSGAGRERTLTPEDLAKGMKKGDEDGPVISVWGSSPGEEVKKRREDYEIGVWQPEGGSCHVGRPGFGNDNWEVGVWDPSVGDPNFALKKQMMNAAEGWDIGVWDPSKPEGKVLTEEAFKERMRKLQIYSARQAEARMQALARQQGDIKLKEELKRKEEELKKQQEELERREEELMRQEEQRMEEMRRRDEEEKRRIEQRQQQMRQEEILRQKEESNRRVVEEERKRKDQEMLVRQQEKDMQQKENKKKEMMRQELQRQQEQVLRRLQQQQQQHQQQQQQQHQQQADPVKLPNSALWGQITTSVPTSGITSSSESSPSLSKIQNRQAQQEERDRQEKQRRMQAQIQEQQQQNRAGWASKVSSNVNGKGSTKSLREIQEEQSRQQKLHKSDPSPSKSQPNLPLTSAAVWRGNTNTSLNWGSGSSDNSNSVWGSSNASSVPSGGFWDECARESPVIPKPKASDNHFPILRPSAPNQNLTQQQQQQQQHTQSNSKSRTAKEEENVKRLFQNNMVSDEFTTWCEMSLRSMAASVDIPTFIAFLQDVDSPYELHDYVKVYLGESRETADFARQFLERRHKMRQMETPWIVQGKSSHVNSSSYGDWESDSMRKSGGGKKKKRFQTLDPSILGFSVNPADRINMGEIQTVDD